MNYYVIDLLKETNIERQAELICERKPYYEESYNKENVKKIQKEFVDMLLSLKPKFSDGIIVFEKYWDNITEDDKIKMFVSPEYYELSDLKKIIKLENIECPVKKFNEKDTADNLKNLCEKLFDKFPTPYAFEFTEWENILGWRVYKGNLNEFELQECIYSLLFEMSFNGMTRESQEERKQELDKAIKESEDISKMPKEEQEKKYISFDTFIKEMSEEYDIELPTREELDENIRLMWLCALKTAVWRYNNFQNMISFIKNLEKNNDN